MRHDIPQDSYFRLRLNSALLDAVRAAAARDGRSVSALVRDAMQLKAGVPN